MEIPFPLDVLPPPHIAVEYGVVTKISSLIPQLQEEYDVIGTCSLCLKPINSVSFQLNREHFIVILVSNFSISYCVHKLLLVATSSSN